MPTATGKHVALIRGINVGRAKRVAMQDLRALVEDLGYSEVSTLLNSGNVVFASSRAAGNAGARIEKELGTRLGVPARVIVLTAAELAAIVKGNPLGKVADDPSRLLVAVFAKPQDRRRLSELARQDWAPEKLAIGPRAAYLWCPNGVLKNRLFEEIGRVLGESVTTRNWSTMMKLHAAAGL